jgi:starch synthase (maltosyl-transferring)
MKQGPRIYNLFPLLAGTMRQWLDHLDAIASMRFNAIYLNPVTRSGGSRSLYAVADYEQLDPRFDDGSGLPSKEQLRRFIVEAGKRDLSVYMDLVVNHTANDSALVRAHPGWYRRDANGMVEAPYAVDPTDPANLAKRTVWGDLAELDYSERPERREMIAFFDGVVRRAVELGFAGFRCDAAFKLPSDVWKALIHAARARDDRTLFLAETLGAPLDEIRQLRSAGFDYFFNSSKWWDFRSKWLLEQYEQLRRIAPSIAFPESHDTPRLAAEREITEVAAAERAYRFAYGFAALFSSGVMMPMGFEIGARKALNVVSSSLADVEEPWIDLRAYVAAIHEIKAAQPAFNEEGPQRRLDLHTDRALGLVRRTADGGRAAVTLLNPGELPVSIERARVKAIAPHEVTPAIDNIEDTPEHIVLMPSSLRIFVAQL